MLSLRTLALFVSSVSMVCSHAITRSPGQSAPIAGRDSLGYKLNHFGLVVESINDTHKFYGEVLGFVELFSFDASADYTVSIIGNPDGNGVIEFLYLRNTPTVPRFKPKVEIHHTFSHVGITVPDLSAAQARFESLNIPIVKRIGAATDRNGVIPPAWGLTDPQKAAVALTYIDDVAGFKNFLVIADPDGNLIEVSQAA